MSENGELHFGRSQVFGWIICDFIANGYTVDYFYATGRLLTTKNYYLITQ